MPDGKYTRTTITIAEELLFEIKKKALVEKKTIREIVEEGLSAYLGREPTFPPSPSISSLFGTWGKGPSGLSFVKKARYGKVEKEREKYLEKSWKKS